ncbi:hypothetical protein L208DRAFT_1337862, partial [Tricholoma matsutake]
IIKLHTQFSFVTFFRCLTLFTPTRGRIFLIVIVTPIGGLQDVLWIARWDRGVAIHLILNLLNLNKGCHGHGAGAGLAAGFVVVFTRTQVKECFLVGTSFVLCFFASNFFFFHSASGSLSVVTFVKSLHL